MMLSELKDNNVHHNHNVVVNSVAGLVQVAGASEGAVLLGAFIS